jgi:hypothetical protein
MDTIAEPDSRQDFARAFGNALNRFLEDKGIRKTDAAKLFGLENGKSRIGSYCHDSPSGKRVKPDAEILYLACTKLTGFYFDYNGYRISAEVLERKGKSQVKKPEQLTLHFDRQFNLTEQAGIVKVKIKRPQGRIELSVSLNAAAS